MSAARIDLAAIPAQRWRNGAGWTREIAAGPGGEDFDWRLSVAEVEREAPFSAFPGVDRCIVVLSGEGMALHDEAGALVQSLRPLEPWSFAGERALHARLPSGACRDFNVMTRRGAWRGDTAVLRAAAQPGRGDKTLLLAARGRWRIGDAAFGALQGLLLDGDAPPVAPLDAAAALLHVRLCHDRQP
ncbi:HutD family protein [Piscinibacter sp.]|uniref:HutD/Ves family protein n=1 Tax=Piscinibacter sp. TaxID=1903157 RepID=UPI0039E305B9